ncbi:hypothetical protein Lalb_Chr07g0194221 [Lupinus albus]|uniref:Uncharacterized protein n=1 Tax=Lupinus albus TaxID=3870 RepID=A0A6A4QB94_LUPAL|nr:hypothetical protein Lalb_Chr07g0194221 [Lupinus albus]
MCVGVIIGPVHEAPTDLMGSVEGRDKMNEGKSQVNRDVDDLELSQLEENEVVSAVATVLADLCRPRE